MPLGAFKTNIRLKAGLVYWVTGDEDGEDTGKFDRRETVPSAPCCTSYIVAVRQLTPLKNRSFNIYRDRFLIRNQPEVNIRL